MECQFKRAFKRERLYTFLVVDKNKFKSCIVVPAQTGINFKCYVPVPLNVAPALNRKHYAQLFYKKL